MQDCDVLHRPLPMRVIEVNRETVRVHDASGEHDARLVPKLARVLFDSGDALAVGDWVQARRDAEGALWLHAREAPRTRLARRDGDGRRHVLVNNVDVVLLVMGLDGDFNPRRLERFIALLSTDLAPRVVLTKADACADVDAQVALLRRRLPNGVGIAALDARDALAVAEQVVPWLPPGCTAVMLGSSGAGKSTLTNTLLGDEAQDTGGQRNDSRGRHTTTRRTLYALPTGACIIDTPGVRTLRPDGDEASLAAGFADIATLASTCRFRNCRHQGEPGCAVIGQIDDDRLANFHKLKREVQRDAMTPLDRQAQLSQWKARSRAARARSRDKREG